MFVVASYAISLHVNKLIVAKGIIFLFWYLLEPIAVIKRFVDVRIVKKRMNITFKIHFRYTRFGGYDMKLDAGAKNFKKSIKKSGTYHYSEDYTRILY